MEVVSFAICYSELLYTVLNKLENKSIDKIESISQFTFCDLNTDIKISYTINVRVYACIILL